MKSFIQKHLAILVMVLVTGVVLVGANNQVLAATAADNATAVCEGIGLTGSGCNQTSGPTVNSTVKLAISLLSFVVGIAAVIMIIVGGFKYVISSGDSNNINSAKNTILYAIVGLVVAVMAQVLVRYVLNQAR